MKETISVNLASQAFTFDKDAYRRLKEYLDAIRRRLPAGDPEILNDVEARLAEIFRSRISSPMMVVTLQMVQGAMAQMGDPSEFGELPTGEKRDEASVDAERPRASIPGTCTVRGRIVRSQACAAESLSSSGSTRRSCALSRCS